MYNEKIEKLPEYLPTDEKVLLTFKKHAVSHLASC